MVKICLENTTPKTHDNSIDESYGFKLSNFQKHAIEAINKHGPFKGLWLAIKRISKCHPWGDSGHDPVP